MRTFALVVLAAVASAGVSASAETYGAEGRPVDEGCSTEPGGDETMAPQVDGSLLFPGAACSATFRVGNATQVLWIQYSAGSRPGHACGLWQFAGAFVGASELRCAAPGDDVRQPVHVERRQGAAFTVTWVPTSWRHDTASLCMLGTQGAAPGNVTHAGLDCATEPLAPDCIPGLGVDASPGRAVLDWPDIEGAAMYNASATRLEAAPPSPAQAADGLAASAHAFSQASGTYAYVVTAFGPQGTMVAAFCQAMATVGPASGSEVPFFTGPWALAFGLGAVLVAGIALARRHG